MAPDIVVYKSPDQMKAYLFVPEQLRGSYPSKTVLLERLAHAGVLHGVDEGALDHMVAETVCDRRVQVATGRAPAAGTHGKLQILIDTSERGRPRQLENGGVNHRDLQLIFNVRAGTPLARRIPPVPGKPGITITGEPVEPPPVQPAEFRQGVGTKVSDEDPDVLVAAVDGQVMIERDGRISVTDSRIIRGDVDYSTGNISVLGNLRITGSVRAGFEVRARGMVSIGGSVEDARVYCTGDLQVAGGAVGSEKALIRCGGSVAVHHVEGFSIDADKDVVIAEDAVHAKVQARGTAKVRAVVGGSISAGAGIIAHSIGAPAETRTIVELGGAYLLRMQRQEAESKQEGTRLALHECGEEMFRLVRDSMDESGQLEAEQETRLDELKKRRELLGGQHEKLEKQIRKIDEAMDTALEPVVKTDTLFPNTMVRFGPMEKVIREKLSHVVIGAQSDRITITRQI
jgi:hypothetical protein